MHKLVVTILSCCLLACVNDRRQRPVIENSEYFPLKSFLQSQIHQVDSLKLPVYKYSTINKRTDSTLLTSEEFNTLAQEFMEPDINDPSIKKFYQEKSFADQAIPSVTFTYSTVNKELPLQRIDIIINPEPVSDDQVKSVYMEKIIRKNDTTLLKKLYWKTSKNFQIISSEQIKGFPETFIQTKVIWNAPE